MVSEIHSRKYWGRLITAVLSLIALTAKTYLLKPHIAEIESLSSSVVCIQRENWKTNFMRLWVP